MLNDEALRSRERGQEQDRKSFADTGHVFYLLAAFARYRAGEQLPQWIHQGLFEFTLKVLPAFLPRPAVPPSARCPKGRAEYSPTLDGVREIALNALGLGKQQGRNMLAELQDQITDDVMVTMLDIGISVDDFAKPRNVEPRQIKARARRARNRRPAEPS